MRNRERGIKARGSGPREVGRRETKARGGHFPSERDRGWSLTRAFSIILGILELLLKVYYCSNTLLTVLYCNSLKIFINEPLEQCAVSFRKLARMYYPRFCGSSVSEH